ncbi:hypothetical protein HFP57_13705 [Parasphingopyxis algicola]|uniref:hypothetical protein n=1 Tax=Parasphingopyxis algicola TaxID=2026624 RepID=UPI0015A24213|nr:hypothetical protein [Parasphingopyxis algicola]QLC25974.1 hypothetical protein HFP57_13705 [Parasphingopyxis algicola]
MNDVDEGPAEGVFSGTPEAIAYLLLRDIAVAEGRDYRGIGGPENGNAPSRKWILDCYRDCLVATRGERGDD